MYLPKWDITENLRVKACHMTPTDSVFTAPLLVVYQGHLVPPGGG